MLAPEGVSISLYHGLGDLPHFNPDLEGTEGLAVLDFRRRLQESDAVSAPRSMLTGFLACLRMLWIGSSAVESSLTNRSR